MVLLGWANEQMLRSLRYEKSEGRGQELLPHLIGILYPPFVLRLGRQRLLVIARAGGEADGRVLRAREALEARVGHGCELVLLF